MLKKSRLDRYAIFLFYFLVNTHYFLESIANAQILTDAEIATAEVKALSGDRSSPLYLSQLYEKKSKDSKARGRQREAAFFKRLMYYWMLIGAENGDFASMTLYAISLVDKPDLSNCIRAEFWIRKAKASFPNESINFEKSYVKKKCTSQLR
jgi:hypothetical protein